MQLGCTPRDKKSLRHVTPYGLSTVCLTRGSCQVTRVYAERKYSTLNCANQRLPLLFAWETISPSLDSHVCKVKINVKRDLLQFVLFFLFCFPIQCLKIVSNRMFCDALDRNFDHCRYNYNVPVPVGAEVPVLIAATTVITFDNRDIIVSMENPQCGYVREQFRPALPASTASCIAVPSMAVWKI